MLRIEAIVIFGDKDSLGSSRAPPDQTVLIRLGQGLIMAGVVRSQMAVGRHKQLQLEDVLVASITKPEIVYVDERADSHTMTLRINTNYQVELPACTLIFVT